MREQINFIIREKFDVALLAVLCVLLLGVYSAFRLRGVDDDTIKTLLIGACSAEIALMQKQQRKSVVESRAQKTEINVAE